MTARVVPFEGRAQAQAEAQQVRSLLQSYRTVVACLEARLAELERPGRSRKRRAR